MISYVQFLSNFKTEMVLVHCVVYVRLHKVLIIRVHHVYSILTLQFTGTE